MKKKHFTAFAVASLVSGSSIFASDHLDAPNLQPDQGNGDVDINDLYAFQSPTNPDNTVLIMTVNPGAGAISGTSLRESATYSFNVDNDGDSIADVIYSAAFGPTTTNSQQSYTITRTAGGTGTVFASGVSGGTGAGTAALPASSAFNAQVGTFDDPFFFDLNGFNDGFNFTGDDFFAGLNTTAVILEIPSIQLNGGTSNIAVWATTTDGGNQIDRVGRPAINTVLIASERKDLFNATTPDQDSSVFGDEVETAITTLSNADNAANLVSILLPDVLTFDTANAEGFLNGRQLGDDVIDRELNLLTAGAISEDVGDMVDANDSPFLGTFPFLAGANVVPEPSSALLLGLGLVAGISRRSRRS